MEAQASAEIRESGVDMSQEHLHWFQLSKSKDAQYFTHKKVAKAIYDAISILTDCKRLFVCDPTAGTGRLLKPFTKDEDTGVFGIEYDERLATSLKRVIGKENGRTGHLLDYTDYISGQFNVVVANPPFGLQWNVENHFTTLTDLDAVESQAATIEQIDKMMKDHASIAAVIIPTSTWTNQKDKRMVEYIHKHFDVLAKVTVPNMFKAEYDIDVQTDIVFLYKQYSGYSYQRREMVEYDTIEETLYMDEIDTLKNILRLSLRTDLDQVVDGIPPYAVMDVKKIPELTRLTSFEEPDNEIRVTSKGMSGSVQLQAMLDFYDYAGLSHYNSVLGKPSGLKETYFSIPALIRNGADKTIEFCENIGLPYEFPEFEQTKLKKLRKEWLFKATPVYKPEAHELLAYFKHKKYCAEKTVEDDDGEPVFIKGNRYLIKPTWKRHKKVADKEMKEDRDGKVFQEITEIDTGHLSLEVQSEQGWREYEEVNVEQIADFIEVFPLPDIKSVAERFPERVKQWGNVIAKRYPFLWGSQAEDLARVLTKNQAYIGYEMGGGKTVTALAYAHARNFKRALVVCQSSLVDNWLNEAEKFGFTAHALRTHSDITKLQERVKNKDFKSGETEFYVIGQEFLSLEGGKVYDEWKCVKYNKDGEIIHEEYTTSKTCSRGHKYEVMHKQCPKCEATTNDGWTGKTCGECGYIAYSYGHNEGERSIDQYPAYKRINKLFPCVITDESQNFANRSLRGEAVRSIMAKSRIALTGTIMRNYVSDVFLNLGWLMGYENPVFYFKRGDVQRFMNEFGSYEYVSKEYLAEMEDASTRKRKSGRKKLLPAVSNLNRFWRLISPFTVRRLTEDIDELAAIDRERQIEVLPLDKEHAQLYNEYQAWAKDSINRELLKKGEREVNMGIISRALWKLRFVASVPVTTKLLDDGIPEYPNKTLKGNEWNKIRRLVEILTEKKDSGEKSIIFSGLRPLQQYTNQYLTEKGFQVKYMPASVQTKDRFKHIQDFSENDYDVLVTGSDVLNRGYTITAANNVIFLDLQYTPEITDQAEKRVIRKGQEKEVKLIYLLSQGTIDVDMQEANIQKRDAIKHAIDKKAVYADTAQLLKQRDTRSPEMMIAKKMRHKKQVEGVERGPTSKYSPKSNQKPTQRTQKPAIEEYEHVDMPIFDNQPNEEMSVAVEAEVEAAVGEQIALF